MGKGVARLGQIVGRWPKEVVIALAVTVVATILAPIVIALVVSDHVPVWVAVLAGGLGLIGGIIAGAYGEGTRSFPDTYALHVRDALADLRRVFAAELEHFSLRDFIETGIFEPAHLLLQRNPAGDSRGDIRFSVLHPDASGKDFVMADESGLFPAHGHRAESRDRFSLPIQGSFAGIAYQSGKVQASNHRSADDRFSRHPRSASDREYESMVSVPLWKGGEIDGVLNVIATHEKAFSTEDRIYITLLASVIDVARTVTKPPPPPDAAQS
jgi:hypothetical protein